MFTGIVVRGVELTATKGLTYKLKQNSTIFDIGIPKGEYTMPISLVKDDKTMLALNIQDRINVKDRFERTPCILLNKGVFVRNAVLVIDEISEHISGYLLAGMSSLADKMRTTYITDIDYGASIDPGVSEIPMVLHMLDTVANPHLHNHIFAPVISRDFSKNFVNRYEALIYEIINHHTINVSSELPHFSLNSEQRPNHSPHVPFPKLKYILQKIHEHFGFTLVWDLMETDTFEKLALVNNRCLMIDAFLENLKLYSETTKTLKPDTNNYGLVPDDKYDAVQHMKLDQTKYTVPSTSYGLIPATALTYENILVDLDTPTGTWYNPFQQFDKTNGRMLVKASGKISVTINVDLTRYSTWLEMSLVGSVDGYYGHIKWFFEASVNGQRIGFDYIYMTNDEIGDGDTVTFTKTFNITDCEVAPKHIGSYIDFKMGVLYETINEEANNYLALWEAGLDAKVNSIFIDQSKMDAYQTPSYEIVYNNHLEHLTCSEFLTTIRNRFGAYVSEIDYRNKIIYHKQVRDVPNGVGKNRFMLRDERFAKRTIEQSHNWHYKLDQGDEALWGNFLGKIIGDPDGDITHNDYPIDLGPVFYENNEIYLNTGSKVMTGASKSTAKEEVKNYLAIYHGSTDRGDGVMRPTITSDNHIFDGTTISAATPWGLRWQGTDGLYEVFLKNFWKHLVQYMEIEFMLYPDIVEIINFKYENVDFYNFMRFLVREIDFEISDQGIKPTKAIMVKLDI